jgi:transcriptional regulator with XRE-family HTH domain
MMQSQEGQAKIKRGRQARNTGASQLANQHIGERIRLRRTLLGLSQAELGKALGLSFQQMQKYERGASAIGAGQLCEGARALDVPVSFFYDGLDGVSVPTNFDAGERQYQPVHAELEVLGHYM